VALPGSVVTRTAATGRLTAPVRLVHLGLGSFFRAHQAWYTQHASDAGEWGYAAFTGRQSGLAATLNSQDCRYTLITRAADGDELEVISSLSQVYAAAEHLAWLSCLASPALAAVTLTVTEAGYCRDRFGRLDLGLPMVAADVEALRSQPAAPVRTAVGRLVAGLAARRRAGGGPVAIVPCDNLPGNGELTRTVITEFAALVDEDLACWLTDSVTVVATMVDRITPAATDADEKTVSRLTGWSDRCPVVTEPFSDWVLAGSFPAGRPGWEAAGATFTGDLQPFEQRKLWLLNGAHSLLAYAGSIRGHATVAEAVADETCRAWLESWWAEASDLLGQPEAEVASYRAALLERFGNPRMLHRLDQIAADGSQKIRVRVLPVLRAERTAGRLPEGAILVVAAWIAHLRGLGAPVHDAAAAEVVPLAAGGVLTAAGRVLDWLDPGLGDDAVLVAVVAGRCEELTKTSGL
jgi:fructuronate reductase